MGNNDAPLLRGMTFAGILPLHLEMRAGSHFGRELFLWLGASLLAFQPEQGAASEPAATNLLTNAAQVRALSPQEAARRLPVRLRGVFMGQTSAAEMGFVIADQTVGIYLQGPLAGGRFERGDVVEVEGTTDPGGFAPFVRARAARKTGHAEIPPPRPVTLGDLSNGGLDAQWVEVSGVVRSCEPMAERDLPAPPPGTVLATNAAAAWNERKFKMTLASGSDRLSVQINYEVVPENCIDAEVRLRGICFSQHNTSRQFLNPLLLVPRGVAWTVEKPPPSDPFTIPIRPVASLLAFDGGGNFGHRVHVRGVVTHHRPGEFLWLRDGKRGVRVQSTQSQALHVGDEVEVAGFLGRGPYSPVLEDAVYRKLAGLPLPAPVPLESTLEALKHDADLVALEAILQECRPIEDGCVLALDWNGQRVEASLRTAANAVPVARWLPGSRARVEGICSVLTSKSGPISGIWEPQSFQILMRGPEDLAVVAAPSWWTYQHIMLLSGLVAGASLLAVAAVMWLARRRLREQGSHRAMAEAEFAAILSERNRLAREIHDTLAQGLAATSVQLRLAKRHCADPAGGAAPYIDAAQELVRENLEEARNSIWNMRAHVLENNDLAGALQGILQQLSDGSGAQTTFEVTGRTRRLAPVVENNLLRVGQEAITNATKHAHAGSIAVSLDFAEKQFRLRVRDDGQGFNATSPPPGGGCFGLVGIRERAAQLKGELDIRSAPGRGTEISLCVPLSSE
jgi:signal transduction histidine kinase